MREMRINGTMILLEVGVRGKGDDGLGWDGGMELEELADGIWIGFPQLNTLFRYLISLFQIH